MTTIPTTATLTTLAIILLSALLHATIQLGLSALTELYHESATRNITKKTKKLISSFISGSGIITLLFLGVGCFITDRLLGTPLPTNLLCAIVGILAATGIIMFFLYFRRPGTELWIPGPMARFIRHRAKVTDSTTEAFSLGILCSFAELPIIITPIIIATSSILALTPGLQLLSIAFYTIVAILPLLIFRLVVHTGRTAIDIQRWRLRNKTFLRIIAGCAFIVLAAFIITFRILA